MWKIFRVVSAFLMVTSLIACGNTGQVPAGGFEISLSPASLSLEQGSSDSTTINVQRAEGFENEIVINLLNPPSGITSPAIRMAGDVTEGTLNITANSSAEVRSHSLEVQATGGGVIRKSALNLTITSNGSAEELSSLDLINEALTSGELDEETALIYKVYVLFGDNRLPEKYRGDDRHVRGDDIMFDVMSRFEELSPQTQEVLRPFLIPPYYQGSWWDLKHSGTQGSADQLFPLQAPPDDPFSDAWKAVDGTLVKVWYRADEDRQKAEVIAKEVDNYIWPKLKQLMAREPLADEDPAIRYNGGDGRLDIALTPEGDTTKFNKYLYRYKEGNGLCGKRPVYLLIGAAERHLVARVGHELMHAFTFGFDKQKECNEYDWISEATATWAEDYLYPTENSEQGYAPFFLSTTAEPLEKGGEVAINSADQVVKGYREYGTYLFPFYLVNKSGRHGQASIIRAIWGNTERSRNNTSLKDVNDAIPGGFQERWPEFSVYNWNREPVNYYEQWDKLQAHAKAIKHRAFTELGEESLPTDVRHLASFYYSFTFPNESIRLIEFHNPFASGNWPTAKVQALVKIKGKGWQPVEDWTAFTTKTFCRDNPDQDIEELVLIFSNSEWQNPNHVLAAGDARVVTKAYCDCAELANVKAWDGSISYSHSRDVADAEHIKYQFDVNVTAKLTEQYGDEDSVAFEDGSLGGKVTVSYEKHWHDRPEHYVESTFSGSGAPVPYDPNKYGQGSKLFFNIDLEECSYSFYLYGRVEGGGVSYGEPYEGAFAFNELQGEFDGTSLDLSGSAQFPAISYSQLLATNPEIYLLEFGDVVDILGEENLGTVAVSWSFTPATQVNP